MFSSDLDFQLSLAEFFSLKTKDHATLQLETE